MSSRPSLPPLDQLIALAAIVAHRSFRKAADALGASPTALSHMMKTLEANVGVRLLHRTTRSVAPTEAGARLVARLEPVLRDLRLALEEVRGVGSRPSGTLRINASEPAARLLLRDVVPVFLAREPAMTVDLVVDGKLSDIVKDGFDAGVRLGEALPQDMIAVPLGGAVRFVAVASPAYLAAHGWPVVPQDLAQHRCIGVRLPSGKPYRWEFAQDGRSLTVEASGPLILDHVGLMTEAAADGLGIAYVPRLVAAPLVDSGALVEVLSDWCPDIPGLFVYYSGRRHVPAGLAAFIEVLRETSAAPSPSGTPP